MAIQKVWRGDFELLIQEVERLEYNLQNLMNKTVHDLATVVVDVAEYVGEADEAERFSRAIDGNAFALFSGFPFRLRVPLDASVTFWEVTAQSNCLPDTVHVPASRLHVRVQHVQGGISPSAPVPPKGYLLSLPPILRSTCQNPISGYSKAPWGLPSCRG